MLQPYGAPEATQAVVPSDSIIKAFVGLRDGADTMKPLTAGVPLDAPTHEHAYSKKQQAAAAKSGTTKIPVEEAWGAPEVAWRKLGSLDDGIVLQVQFLRVAEVDPAKDGRPLPNSRNLALDLYKVGDAFLSVRASLVEETQAAFAASLEKKEGAGGGGASAAAATAAAGGECERLSI